jgi:hypothetical protein
MGFVPGINNTNKADINNHFANNASYFINSAAMAFFLPLKQRYEPRYLLVMPMEFFY